jgi:transposase-like protein
MNKNANRERKRRRSPEEWSKAVEGWRQSGLPVEDYAERQGVSVGSLYRWSGRLRRDDGDEKERASPEGLATVEAPTPRFLAVQVAEPKTTAGPVNGGRGTVEISWPGGPHLRLNGEVPASTMVALLRTMAEVMPC